MDYIVTDKTGVGRPYLEQHFHMLLALCRWSTSACWPVADYGEVPGTCSTTSGADGTHTHIHAPTNAPHLYHQTEYRD